MAGALLWSPSPTSLIHNHPGGHVQILAGDRRCRLRGQEDAGRGHIVGRNHALECGWVGEVAAGLGLGDTLRHRLSPDHACHPGALYRTWADAVDTNPIGPELECQ